MINARAETAAAKPAFRSAFRRRRCLIPTSGFYEWRPTNGRKQPYYIRMRDGRPFAFAGLWERWEGPDGGSVETCAILTTEANAVLSSIHDRMPVILGRGDHALWLDATVEKPESLSSLLVPFDPAAMTAYPVSTRVNSPSFDDPGCVAPVA